MADLPELVLGSKTQSAETIQKILDQEGYDNVEVETWTNAPPAESDTDTQTTEQTEVPPVETDATVEAAAPAVVAPPAEKPSRIQRLRAKHAAETASLKAENDRIATEAADLRRRLEARATPPAEKPPTATETKPAVAAPAAIDDPEPDPEKYDNGIYDPRYTKDLTRWTTRETRREEDARKSAADAEAKTKRETDARQSAESREEADRTAAEERWKTQADRGKQKYPDFEAKTAQPIYSPTMANVLRDLDRGDDLAYWLASHPEECSVLAKATVFDPEKATKSEIRAHYRKVEREFARIEALLPIEASPTAEDTDTDDDTDDDTADAPVLEPDRPDKVYVPPAAASAQAPAAPAAQASRETPPKAAATPKPKSDPPPSVGSRGGTRERSVEQLVTASRGSRTEEELRNMDADEYRKSRGM